MSEKKYDVYVGNDKIGEVWGESAIDIEAREDARESNRERRIREMRDPAYKRKNDRIWAKAIVFNVISKLFVVVLIGFLLHSCAASEEAFLGRSTYWMIFAGCGFGWLIFHVLWKFSADDYYSR